MNIVAQIKLTHEIQKFNRSQMNADQATKVWFY